MPEQNLSMQKRMKKLFAEGFSVMDIVEPLPVVDSCSPGADALSLVEKTRLPLLGVKEEGRVSGYLRLEDISEGECGSVARSFDDMPVLDEKTSIPAAFEAPAGSPYCFVRVEGVVRAIVGRMDIQKPPVRMWLLAWSLSSRCSSSGSSLKPILTVAGRKC